MSENGVRDRLDLFLIERYKEQRDNIAARNTFPLRSFFSIFSPNWLLVDLDSKEGILKEHEHSLDSTNVDGDDGSIISIKYYDCDVCGSWQYSNQGGWCKTLRYLAVPFYQHKNYQGVWKP